MTHDQSQLMGTTTQSTPKERLQLPFCHRRKQCSRGAKPVIHGLMGNGHKSQSTHPEKDTLLPQPLVVAPGLRMLIRTPRDTCIPTLTLLARTMKRRVPAISHCCQAPHAKETKREIEDAYEDRDDEIYMEGTRTKNDTGDLRSFSALQSLGMKLQKQFRRRNAKLWTARPRRQVDSITAQATCRQETALFGFAYLDRVLLAFSCTTSH